MLQGFQCALAAESVQAAAAVIALDSRGLFIASVVRSGRMSGKGAFNATGVTSYVMPKRLYTGVNHVAANPTSVPVPDEAPAFGGVVMRRIGLNSCPYCGGHEVFRSHPRTWLDRACVFLFPLGRCHQWMHHYYRPPLLPPLEYPNAAGKKPTTTTSKHEKRERSA